MNPRLPLQRLPRKRVVFTLSHPWLVFLLLFSIAFLCCYAIQDKKLQCPIEELERGIFVEFL